MGQDVALERKPTTEADTYRETVRFEQEMRKKMELQGWGIAVQCAGAEGKEAKEFMDESSKLRSMIQNAEEKIKRIREGDKVDKIKHIEKQIQRLREENELLNQKVLKNGNVDVLKKINDFQKREKMMSNQLKILESEYDSLMQLYPERNKIF